MTRHTTRVPASNLAAYKAAALIHAEGPKTIEELYAAIDFGKRGTRAGKITNAIASGWLAEIGGKIVLGTAGEHFAGVEKPMPKFVGIPAAPREPLTPLHLRPALSAKYRTNSRGDHVREVDDRFQRAAGARSYTVAGGQQ